MATAAGFLLMLLCPAMGQTSALQWQYLVDESGSLAATAGLWNMRRAEWRALPGGVANFGFSRAAY